MDTLRIEGGRPLKGTIQISGAKNAALPILCASLLAEGTSTYTNVPELRDIRTTARLLKHLGGQVTLNHPQASVHFGGILGDEAPYDLVKEMRASVLVLGPLVARLGRARVSMPGGCAIGARPIDQHLKGLEKMGAVVALKQGYVDVAVPKGRLAGAEFRFDFPTVTGTENVMCAATLAAGRTVLDNCAREPEIKNLADALRAMGARIQGDGTSQIVIEGQDALHPVKDFRIMPDRIEAGSYMVAAAATGGDVFIDGVTAEIMQAVLDKLRTAGVQVEPEKTGIRVSGRTPFKATDVITAPFPEFPTDMQAQFMVLMCLAQGQSHIEEKVFENRFMHVGELQRMGANIKVSGHSAFVNGPIKLQGATVMATDLRASACLVIAGLVAEGTTEVRRIYHLDRGYETIEKKLSALGATVSRVAGPA